jgi:hypothetical protein
MTCAIDTAASVALVVDGNVCPVRDGIAMLPNGASQAQLTLTTQTGASGAALLRRPISYTFAPAPVYLPSSFAEQGFGDYAGAVQYRRTVTIPTSCDSWQLSLTAVRGTVAVIVNGHRFAPRVWSPYTFDVSDVIQCGENTIELIVTNTLAPYIAGHSPSHYTSTHQEQSGILGRLVLHGGPKVG